MPMADFTPEVNGEEAETYLRDMVSAAVRRGDSEAQIRLRILDICNLGMTELYAAIRKRDLYCALRKLGVGELDGKDSEV